MSTVLEPEQKELLAMLVEAARNLPVSKRQPFLAFLAHGHTDLHVHHPGLARGELKAYPGDFQALLRLDLIRESMHGKNTYEVSPSGFEYYRNLREHSGEPLERMQSLVNSYFDAQNFQNKYPKAYAKWKNAESLLWSSDSEAQLTAIGHFCREALQEFATALVNQYRPIDADSKPERTKNRIRAVINQNSGQTSEKVSSFLKALVEYWDAVNGLDQRQEHGEQKEGEPLVWEDGRRAIFQTAVVMFEIDSCLSHKR